jgi:hypothetical protein
MSGEQESTKGGFHIKARDVKVKAGKDIVAGNQITTTTITTSIQTGFRSEEQKQEFQKQLEALREAFREIKVQVEASRALSADEKDELTAELLEHVKGFKEVKDATAQLPAGQEPQTDLGKTVESRLEKASGFLDKLQGVARKSAELAEKVGGLATKYGPMVLSARHLFGLP